MSDKQLMTTESSRQPDGEPRKWFVYLLTFASGKSYVGVSRDMEGRMDWHWYRSESMTSLPISRAFIKYGEPKVEILATCDSEKSAYKEEMRAIQTHDTQVPNGYNVTAGGKGMAGVPKEIRSKWARKAAMTYRKNTTPEERSKKGQKARAAWTEKSYASMAAKARERLSDPEFKEQAVAGLKQFHQDNPEFVSKEITARWQDPKYRAKVNAAREEAQRIRRETDPEWVAARKRKMAESMRKKWQDPEYRARRAAAMARPEVRAKQAANGRKGAAALTEDGRKKKSRASRKSALERWSRRKKFGDIGAIGPQPSSHSASTETTPTSSDPTD